MSKHSQTHDAPLAGLVAETARLVAKDAQSICELAKAMEQTARQWKAQATDDLVSKLQQAFRTLVQCSRLIRNEKDQLALLSRRNASHPSDRI